MQTVAPSSSEALETPRRRNHEALTVVVVDAHEFELQVDVAREGPGRVTSQHVDFTRSQRGETRLTGRRHELDSIRIIQNRSRDCTANGDVEAFPNAFSVRRSKADKTRRNATGDRAFGLDVFQRVRTCCGGGERQRRTRGQDCFEVHNNSVPYSC